MTDSDATPAGEPDARTPAGADAAMPPVDAARAADATPDTDATTEVDGAPAPYRHTIAIDGANDFFALDESFVTTSSGYSVYVSYDETQLYVGYDGDDVASADANKWVLVYFDTDPGHATGALAGEQYNTQQPGMPSGFGAEYAFRWRASNDFQQLQAFADDAWSDTGVTPTTYQSGSFVETAIPLSALGTPTTLGITSLMINETSLAEGAYAGLYADSFADGYYDSATGPIPLTRYLAIDFASPLAPNDPAHERP